MDQTVNNTVVKQAITLQGLTVALKYLSIEHKPHNFVAFQLNSKVAPEKAKQKSEQNPPSKN